MLASESAPPGQSFGEDSGSEDVPSEGISFIGKTDERHLTDDSFPFHLMPLLYLKWDD